MLYVEKLLLLTGLGLVLLAYSRYWKRTADGRGLALFWRRELMLNPVEFRLQRAGIMVLVFAVGVRLGLAIWPSLV